MLIYGHAVRDKIKEKIKTASLSRSMNLYVLQVGEDPGSVVYVNNIGRLAGELGIGFTLINFAPDIKEQQLISKIEELNRDTKVTGIMIQTPLPQHLNANKIINSINYRKDVEGIHNYNLGQLLSRQPGVRPCTPQAVIDILKAHQVKLEGEKIVVIGRSVTVGSPLAAMMTLENATVTLCHSFTRDLAWETKNANILVACVGKRNFLTPEMVKEGGVIIDVGINFDDSGKLCGDVHEEARAKARLASAVPGGVGVITVTELFNNLTILDQQKSEY